MNRAFYKLVRLVGGRIFFHASAPRILHRERADRKGAYLLAANHLSPYDAPLLIAVTPRIIHWLSIVEIFQNPFIGWFLRGVGAEPLRRGEVDTRTMRVIVRHLRAGEVVGIFPEGRVRTDETSVLVEGEIHKGVCKLAHLARVPVLPCVVLGGGKFSQWTRWLPGVGTRWAVAYGEPIFPQEGGSRDASSAAMASEITTAFRALRNEIADYV